MEIIIYFGLIFVTFALWRIKDALLEISFDLRKLNETAKLHEANNRPTFSDASMRPLNMETK